MRHMADGLGIEVQGTLVRLRLALYGRPLSGAFRERHCTEQLRSLGFEPAKAWGSTFIVIELQTVLSVYIDDFEMAGPKGDTNKA